MDSNLWSLPRGWVVQLKPISRALSDRCYPVGRLVRQMPVAWCEPDQESRMVLTYFRQLVVGKIGESVQTQWHEHGSSGRREAPSG